MHLAKIPNPEPDVFFFLKPQQRPQSVFVYISTTIQPTGPKSTTAQSGVFNQELQ